MFKFKFKKPNFKFDFWQVIEAVKGKFRLFFQRRTIVEAILFRKRVKYIALFLGVVLIGVFILQIVIKNPKEGKAFSHVPATKTFTINDASAGFFQFSTAMNKSVFFVFGGGTELDVDGYNVTINGDSNGNGGCDAGDNNGVLQNVYNFLDSLHFNNLTITNCAVVTHPALITVYFGGPPNYILSTTGERMKIDITLDGDLTLSVGGSIDVTGKGYPGATIDTHLDGYGPGHGHGGIGEGPWNERANCTASGGGYGGIGGAGDRQYGEVGGAFDSSIAGGAVYGSASDLLPGSGGGMAGTDPNGSASAGGSGGGRIKIKTNSLKILSESSIISANGADYAGYAQYCRNGCSGLSEAYGGGGSGGAIQIEAKSYEFSLPSTGLTSVFGGSFLGQQGVVSLGDIYAYRIYANGGNSGPNDYDWRQNRGGGGGGGRITLIDTSTPPLTIRKEIVGITNGINPYSLKKGDRVQINLHIAGMRVGEPITVKDDILQVVGGLSCSGSIVINDVPSVTEQQVGNQIVWTGYIPDNWKTPDTTPFFYQCSVQ